MFPILEAGPSLDQASLPAFVVARDGLYLRKRSLLGLSQTKVGRVAHLPESKEFVEYALPKVPADLMARAVGFFRAVYRLHRTEAAVLLVWRAAGFDLAVPAQKVSSVSVKFDLTESDVPAGSRLVGSMHSHGGFSAYASSIDEDDDAELDGLHIVVGDFDRRRLGYSAAIVVDGIRFHLKTGQLLERPRRLAEPPEEWLRKVKLAPPPRRRRASRRWPITSPGASSPRTRSRSQAGGSSMTRSPRRASSPRAWAIASPTGSCRFPARARREARPMADRIVLIGCGGIGSQLLPPLVRYLANRPEPRQLLVLVDGDVFEPGNRSRQACSQRDLGSNKAEALARVARDDGLAVQAIPEFLDETNVRSIVREGDIVLLAVDNHRARALVDRHLGSLSDATLISGGNDETDGNVQLVRRRDGWSVDGHLTEIHPEIGMATEEEPRGDGCQVMAAERPQLLVTNLMVASAMLSCLWQITERGSVPYSEVYLDAIQNAARSRSWFRVPAGAQ